MRLTLLLLCFSHLLPAQEAHGDLKKADRLYDKQQFKPAEEAYKTAAQRDPRNPQASFNLGNAIYQQGRYEEAGKVFEKTTAATRQPDLKADALHNLGNTWLKQQKYEEAVKAYENSLRLRPGDPETKVNLQLAKKKQQQQQQQQEQQQQKQQQQQQPQTEESTERQRSRDQAKKLLETAVSPQDQKSAQKYREQERPIEPQKSKKDW